MWGRDDEDTERDEWFEKRSDMRLSAIEEMRSIFQRAHLRWDSGTAWGIGWDFLRFRNADHRLLSVARDSITEAIDRGRGEETTAELQADVDVTRRCLNFIKTLPLDEVYALGVSIQTRADAYRVIPPMLDESDVFDLVIDIKRATHLIIQERMLPYAHMPEGRERWTAEAAAAQEVTDQVYRLPPAARGSLFDLSPEARNAYLRTGQSPLQRYRLAPPMTDAEREQYLNRIEDAIAPEKGEERKASEQPPNQLQQNKRDQEPPQASQEGGGSTRGH